MILKSKNWHFSNKPVALEGGEDLSMRELLRKPVYLK